MRPASRGDSDQLSTLSSSQSPPRTADGSGGPSANSGTGRSMGASSGSSSPGSGLLRGSFAACSSEDNGTGISDTWPCTFCVRAHVRQLQGSLVAMHWLASLYHDQTQIACWCPSGLQERHATRMDTNLNERPVLQFQWCWSELDIRYVRECLGEVHIPCHSFLLQKDSVSESRNIDNTQQSHMNTKEFIALPKKTKTQRQRQSTKGSSWHLKWQITCIAASSAASEASQAVKSGCSG